MREQELKSRLTRAVGRITPDVLDGILLSCGERKGNDMTAVQTTAGNVPAANKAARQKKMWARLAGAAAAAIVALFAVFAGVNYYTVDSIVGLDVNPSIRLEANKNEEILNAVPLNGDAETVLDGMDLKGVDIDVAINALIGSMLKNGYVNELKNSILISVENNDDAKARDLQERLSSEIDKLLRSYSVDGAVLSQTLPEDGRIEELAARYGISIGKASLIDTMVSQDSRLNFADLAGLSINDLNLIAASKNAELPGVSSTGTASSSAYIGEDKARSIAFGDAGVDASVVSYVKVEMDSHDGRMVYEVEFFSGSAEYDYKIDALDGSIIGCDAEGAHGAPPQAAQGGADYIGEDEAKSAALAHAGLSADSVTFIKAKLDHDDGRAVYDVEFYSGSAEYDYEIDAVSGSVIKWDQDAEGHHAAPQAAQGGTAGGGAGYIGEDGAKSAALAHAGLSADSVTFIKAGLDHDDGRAVYDVEFYSGGMEYNYEIDAVNGSIIEYDAEYDD
jgi:uncharacterized membrane protein YkoI